MQRADLTASAFDGRGLRCQSHAVKSCGPSGSQDLAFLRKSTSSLSERGTSATGGKIGLFAQFLRLRICDQLPPIATTGLHKGSIRCNQTRQQTALAKALLITSLIERGSSGFTTAFGRGSKEQRDNRCMLDRSR